MADVNISKYRASVVRDGSKPASPGFVVSEGQDPVNPPGTNNFVPYTGATANIELGEYGLESGFVTLDTTPTNTPTDQGTIYWDDARSTAALIMNGTLQHIGQDTFFYVKNSSGSSIPKGTAVMFAGTDGASGHILITPFLANGSVPSSYFMGVTSETIANGSFGQVMHFGELDGINTSAFTAGALLYASTTVAGGFQTTAPVAPNNIVLVAAAINSKNNGAIIVRPQIGSNINNDEGVKITSPTTGDLLQLQAGGLWENKTLAQVIGSAYVPSTRTITINGTTQDLSANRTFNVGTVTSVGLSSATSGVTIGSTPVTSSGTITLAIATASGSQNGLLSSTDWTTFNNKENGITAGTTAQYFRGDKTFQTLNTAVVPELTNLYYTDARSRAALSFAAGSGAYNSSTGVITIPTDNNQITNGAGYITSSALGAYLPLIGGTLTGNLNGTTANFSGSITVSSGNANGGGIILADDGDIVDLNDGYASMRFSFGVRIFSANRSGSAVITLANTGAISANGNITGANLSGTNTGDVTLGTANGLSLSGQALSLGLASGSANGALSSSDWTTFNNKQNALTNPVTGTGTTNYLPKFTGASTIGNSQIFDNGTNVGIGIINAPQRLTINEGGIGFSGTSLNSTDKVLYSPTDGLLEWFTHQAAVAAAFAISHQGDRRVYLNVNGSSYFNGGNLLVGTTSDNGARLQVNGGRLHVITPDPASNYVAIDFRNPTFGIFGKTNSIPARGNTLEFTATDFNSGGGIATREVLTLRPEGNVGIGTSSPSSLFTVAGTSDLAFSNATTVLRINRSGSQARIQNYDGGSVAPIALNWEGGNVLIGTTTDNGARFQVSGTTTFSSSVTAGGDISLTGPGNNIRLTGAGPNNAFISESWGINLNGATTHPIQVRNASLSVGYVLGGGIAYGSGNLFVEGNVLIGTTTDVGARLHVNGDVRTAAPTGGSAVNWRLGTVRGGTVTPNATVRVEIGGVLVDLDARYV